MCPVCLAAAALLAAKVTTTGGLAVVGIMKYGVTRGVDDHPAASHTKEDRHD